MMMRPTLLVVVL